MAFSMDLKVVKVGDIDAPPEEQSYLWPDTSTSESTEIALDQFTWKSTSQFPVCSGGWSVYHNDDLVQPVSEEVELPEEGGAPDNWPQIPQLSRRRSCEACGERTNCVNKAVEHLQLLHDILTDWIQETEAVSEATDADRKLSICDFDPTDTEGALVPLTTDLVTFTSVEALKDYNSHAQLKAVVKEVMLLLAWLHDDCQRTEAKLQSEKALSSQLSLKIDEMSRRKFTDLSAAVQKEHDLFKQKNRPCMVHLTYLNRIHAICQNKLKSVHHLNFHLKKDIAIRNEQIPLVQHKMRLENQQIDKIQKALSETEQMMSETLKNQAETDSKYREALEIVKKEKYLLFQQINAVCHELNVVSNEADEAEKTYYKMGRGIVDGKERIKNNEKEMLILKVKLDNTKTKSFTLQKQNKGEKENLIEQLKETKQMKSVNKKLEEQTEKTKNECKAKILEIDNNTLKLEQELQSLIDINEIKSDNIGCTQIKIDDCKKQKSFYEKNLKRMTHEIMKLENQISLTLDELKRMQEVNRLLRMAILREQAKNVEKESSLNLTIDHIRKEVDIENKVYLEMATKVQDLEFELRNVKFEAEEGKEKLLFMLSDANEALQKLEDKIRRLTNLRLQKVQALVNLNEKKVTIKERYEKAIEENEGYLAALTPYQQISEDKSNELEMKLYEMSNEEEKMKMEMELMIQQGNALAASRSKIEKDTLKLKEILQELNFKLEAASKSCIDTRARWDQVNERLHKEQNDHDDLIRYRKEVLEDILQKKQQNLEENKQLASKYRTDQNTLVQRKKEYVQLSEDTVLLKQALKDLKQLLSLQMKIQHNSTRYHQYRGLFHSKQLAYFVHTSEGNKNKIKQLQGEIDSKMEIMTTHLNEVLSRIFQRKQHFLPKITIPTS